MLIDHWPLLGLRLTTPRLELRLPDGEELAALADLAALGVHPPEEMPFMHPWTDLPAAERARSVVQHHWLRRGTWTPDHWSLQLTVFFEGRPVGVQDLSARDFAVLRRTSSGSWLGRAYQGLGIGTEMRAAVLRLAFDGLGAHEAVSSAMDHNAASLGVSRKLGYERDGIERLVVRGGPATEIRLRLPRTTWEAKAPGHPPTEITGLDPCLPLFGVGEG
ncbi:GNAT family N-acetyltransferase [Streptomyces radicis]|uniref:N-acetyltransferase n=1 Tax=Streptomyces radicis TaxID=1750517 RepID=A0A3A9W7M6_9ACTN|nr:GNAT family protein [Streptomyces radicis]RKN08732.1 N-acetyltransferase [Streptomyces radicis]RKN21890.1 N-acetyltransferase [Streptomyces radicis]